MYEPGLIEAERLAQTAGQPASAADGGSGKGGTTSADSGATSGAGSGGSAGTDTGGAGSSGGGGTAGGSDSGAGTGGTPGDVADPVVCGDGEVDLREKCDTSIPAGQQGACPSECPMLECTPRKLSGSMCGVECVEDVLACADGDGCCGPMCDHDSDDDCPANCGDGAVQSEQGETCEPDSDTPCITDAAECNDELPCTKDALEGSAENCNAKCSNTAITNAVNGDGCCLPESNHNVDSDCTVLCGNKVREMGEECDGSEGCDANCRLGSTLTPDQDKCMQLLAGKGDKCDECACLRCTKEALLCRASGQATRDAQCTKVLDCANEHDCVRDVCYCGAPFCLPFTAGPCRTEIDQAVASEGSGDVLSQREDTRYAIGRAVATTDCNALNCADVCP